MRVHEPGTAAVGDDFIAGPASAKSPAPERLSSAEIRAAVRAANVPALLMVVFQVTGDERWLEPPYQPTRGAGLSDHDTGGLSEALQNDVREAAVEAIIGLQDGRRPVIEEPSPELVTRMMGVSMCEDVRPEYGSMLATELLRRTAPFSDRVTNGKVAVPDGYRAVIIGAGMGGIIAAQELLDMGIDFVILEKQPEPGGVWHQNTYPGCGVDTPSHLYSFGFARNDCTNHFDMRDTIQQYCASVLKRLGIQDHVRYGTEVLASAYQDDTRQWRMEVRRADGATETLEANLLLSAVGVLNRPSVPDVPGAESFSGMSFHTAAWPNNLDLSGKRVAIVGAGASAMQVVPAIAGQVESLVVFQRTPQWIAPFDKFQQRIEPDLRALLRICPLYHAWYWMRLFWQFGDNVIDSLRVDPSWEHPERSVNARNDGHRRYFTRYIEKELGSRTDLIEKVVPDYPPYGKRILLDNGWYRALCRDNVTLVNESVSEIREGSVVSESGMEHEVDVLIWATGFQPTRYVSSMDVRGLGGASLRETWDDDDPRAYFGVAVLEFPNFFMLSGPNSFPGAGSVIFFMEVQMRYIRGLLTEMFDRQISAIDPTDEANRRYNDLVEQRHREMIWSHPGMTTYYRNTRGRVVVVMPFLNVEYWNMTQRPDLENYTAR